MYEVKIKDSYFAAQKDMKLIKKTIGEFLKEVATTNPNNQALVEIDQNNKANRNWTYEELYNNSLKLAIALSGQFKKGSRVVIWSPNSPEWVLLEYAAALSGIIIVTANPSLQKKELKYIIEQSQSEAVFYVNSFRGNNMKKIVLDAIEGNEKIKKIVNLENEGELYFKNHTNNNLPIVYPSDPAQIQYTSGTTGFPKGAVLTHCGLINNAFFYSNRCEVSQKSSWINIMPLFHTSGCGMVTLGCLTSKCRMILTSFFDPEKILNHIKDFDVDIILGVPTMILSILEQQEKQKHKINSLNLVSCGGSNVAPEMVKRVQKEFNCKFSTLYGQTEYCPVITQHHNNDSIEDICNTIGQPISHTEVSIRSINNNKICPSNTVGEICVRGPSTMLKYFANKEATSETIDKNNWLHTGDLGRMDNRGYVTITGRIKEMIIRGGENHFPAEIENALREHKNISDLAVVGIPDKKWGELIVAFIKFEDSFQANKDEMIKFFRSRMSPQKTPNLWFSVDKFPLTGSGIILIFILKNNYLKNKNNFNEIQ